MMDNTGRLNSILIWAVYERFVQNVHRGYILLVVDCCDAEGGLASHLPLLEGIPELSIE